MRISDYTIRLTSLRDVQARLGDVAGAQERAVTGKRVNAMSDAPADAAQILTYGSQLRDMEAYQRTGKLAATRLDAEEQVVKQAQDLVQQAKDLAASVVNTSATDPLRQTVSIELQSIHDQLVALGNTHFGNEYMFAGALTDQPPFLADGTYVGDSTARRATLDAGLTIDVSHPGDVVLGSTFTALTNLEAQISTGNSNAIQASVSALDAAHQDLLTREAEIATRQRVVDDTSKILAARTVNVADTRDGIANVDPAQSSVELVTAQNALERAYAVVGKVLQSSLLDYLR
jgi:flagellar hook-associated protein 3 FlgL